jgi:hypothetical protein
LFKHSPQSHIWVLCLSDECYQVLLQGNQKNVFPIMLSDLERAYPELINAKENRNIVEYYFTLTPFLPKYVIDKTNGASSVTYLDSDLYFFSDPQLLFNEIGSASVAIMPHFFPPRLRFLEKRGKYNVSWITFAPDINGIACLDWYAKKCLEWCHDYIDGDRYADQKYLDLFSQKFENVHVINHHGANVAPWNIENYIIALSPQILIDGKPLIFYHFQGLKHVLGKLWDTGLFNYKSHLSLLVNNHLYKPYIASLLNNPFPSQVSSYKVMPRIEPAQGFGKLFNRNGSLYSNLKMLKLLFDLIRTRTFILFHSCHVK